MRIPAGLLLSILLLCPFAARAGEDSSPTWNRGKEKAATELAERWWQARPNTRFEEWDAAKRAPLVEEAKAFGKIPEGKLEDVVEALWKPVKKFGPQPESRGGKPKIDTPYGEAWWIQNGSGRGKGLVIGLHGGGPGQGSASEATKWHAKNCIGMYPQGIELVHDTWNTVHGERFILTLIEIAKAQHDIDPDRVYVMGFSMGSTGSFFMAGRHPDLFAGAIPGNGVLMAQPKSQVWTKEEVAAIQPGILPNLRNVALWYYTGSKDDHCMPGTFLFANDRLNELKEADPGGYEKIRFQEYEGLAHAFPPGEPEKGISFIEDQKRDTFPKTIVWEYAANPFPLEGAIEGCDRIQKHWYYWLKAARPRDRMYVRATIEDNVIEIEQAGAGGEGNLTIFLNDEMIDPKKEVVVRMGKKEVYRGKPEPDFWTVLESLDARLDRRMVFDRRIEL